MRLHHRASKGHFTHLPRLPYLLQNKQTEGHQRAEMHRQYKPSGYICYWIIQSCPTKANYNPLYGSDGRHNCRSYGSTVEEGAANATSSFLDWYHFCIEVCVIRVAFVCCNVLVLTTNHQIPSCKFFLNEDKQYSITQTPVADLQGLQGIQRRP